MKYYLNNNYFFITSRTIDGVNYFREQERKRLLVNKLLEVQRLYNFKCEAYVVLDNHYHLLFYLSDGNVLSEVIKRINGGVSRLLENEVKPIWDNYYISNVYNENAFYKVMGYILGNPWKHHLVSDLNDLANYRFSNYNELVKELGLETLREIIYSVKNLNWELNLLSNKYNQNN